MLCFKCGGWIVGGASYISDGITYCPDCFFDGSGRFVDTIKWRLHDYCPTEYMARVGATGVNSDNPNE